MTAVRRLLALVLVASALLAPAAPVEAARPAPTVTPLGAVVGEPLAVRAQLPTRARRAVVLQRRQGSRWVTLARATSTSTGRVGFTVPAARLTLRVHAPRTRAAAAYTSGARSFRPRLPVPRLVAEATDLDVSANGRYVAFTSSVGDPSGEDNVFTWDRVTGSVDMVSYLVTPGDANGYNSEPSISADGRTIAFRSDASNLVAGDTNGEADIVLWESGTGFSIVSVDDAGNQGAGGSFGPSLSDDARTVAFESTSALEAADTNGQGDVYVRFRDDNLTVLASARSVGGSADGRSLSPAVSGDGRWVVFTTGATDLVPGDTNGRSDIVRRSLYAPDTRMITRGGDSVSTLPSISYDGRRVAFLTSATNLAPGTSSGNTDVLVWDAATGRRTVASRPTHDRGLADAGSNQPAISGNGRYVVFLSFARNLVPGDTHGRLQAFVRNLDARVTSAVSLTRAQRFGSGDSYAAAIDHSGRHVALVTFARLTSSDPDAGLSLYGIDRRTPPG